jgi:hypothetical protein
MYLSIICDSVAPSFLKTSLDDMGYYYRACKKVDLVGFEQYSSPSITAAGLEKG